MTVQAGMVVRASKDFVQRLRVMLANTGDDGREFVDKLTPDAATEVAVFVCENLGIQIEDTDVNPRRKPHIWQASMRKRK